jgi:hypothetical protein
MDDTERQALTKSLVTREGKDLCRWTLVGEITEAELRRVFADQTTLMADCDVILQILDLRRVGTVAADARKVAVEVADVRVLGSALFGASLHIRMLAKLVTTAIALFRKAKVTDTPVLFFETEREALDWLEQRRAEIAKQRG